MMPSLHIGYYKSFWCSKTKEKSSNNKERDEGQRKKDHWLVLFDEAVRIHTCSIRFLLFLQLLPLCVSCVRNYTNSSSCLQQETRVRPLSSSHWFRDVLLPSFCSPSWYVRWGTSHASLISHPCHRSCVQSVLSEKSTDLMSACFLWVWMQQIMTQRKRRRRERGQIFSSAFNEKRENTGVLHGMGSVSVHDCLHVHSAQKVRDHVSGAHRVSRFLPQLWRLT